MSKVKKTVISKYITEYRNEKGEFHNINDKPAIILSSKTKLGIRIVNAIEIMVSLQ